MFRKVLDHIFIFLRFTPCTNPPLKDIAVTELVEKLPSDFFLGHSIARLAQAHDVAELKGSVNVWPPLGAVKRFARIRAALLTEVNAALDAWKGTSFVAFDVVEAYFDGLILVDFSTSAPEIGVSTNAVRLAELLSPDEAAAVTEAMAAEGFENLG